MHRNAGPVKGVIHFYAWVRGDIYASSAFKADMQPAWKPEASMA